MLLEQLSSLKQSLVRRGSFTANVMTLMLGTALSQGLMIILAPLLARLYTPEDFGVYSLYAGIIGVIGVAVSLNYDLAVVLPRTDEEAVNVAALAIAVAAGAALLTFAVLCVFPLSLIYPANPGLISGWVWVLPLSAIAMGLSATLQAWCTRMKLFAQASRAKVASGAATAGVQVAGGYGAWGPSGLIYGPVLGDLVGAALMFYMALGHGLRGALRQVRWAKMREMAARHADFPVYSSSQNILNAVSLGAPAFLLTHYFGIKEAGFYLLGIKLIQVPADLVSQSFRQVFYQKAAETHHAAGDLKGLFVKSTGVLLALAAVPALILFCFAPIIFKTVLGAQWESAGEYSRWLVVWIAVNFANVPAICCYRILNLQRTLFWVYVFYMAARIGALVAGGSFCSAETTVLLFAGVGFIFNVFMIGLIWKRLSRYDTIPA